MKDIIEETWEDELVFAEFIGYAPKANVELVKQVAKTTKFNVYVSDENCFSDYVGVYTYTIGDTKEFWQEYSRLMEN